MRAKYPSIELGLGYSYLPQSVFIALNWFDEQKIHILP